MDTRRQTAEERHRKRVTISEESACSSSSCASDVEEDESWSPRGDGDGEDGDDAVDGAEAEAGAEKPAGGKYVCKVCRVRVRKPALLRQHMAAHTDERPHACPVDGCDRSYKRQDHLNRHALTHQGKLFLCPVEGCTMSFTINANLHRHLGLHEKWGPQLLRGSQGVARDNLVCPEPGCGKAFRYPSLLQSHIDGAHRSMVVDQTVCMEPNCGESFADLAELYAHRKKAHCFAICEVCGLSMMKSKLKTHMLQHEGGLPCIRCPYPRCLHSYTKKSNLDTHIRAVHQELKLFMCSYAGCEMRFAYKAVRDKHENSSVHPKPPKDGDFETEDLEFMMKPRGGRKRVILRGVDDLLVKRRTQPAAAVLGVEPKPVPQKSLKI